MAYKRLGDVLIDAGLITEDQLGHALKQQKETKRRLGDELIAEGVITEAGLIDRHHMLFTFLTKALGIPEEQAEKEACLMEHAISDESFKKWSSYINKLDL